MSLIDLLPLLQAGGNTATIGILIIAFRMYNKIVNIEKDIAIAKALQDVTKERVDRLERKVFNGITI